MGRALKTFQEAVGQNETVSTNFERTIISQQVVLVVRQALFLGGKMQGSAYGASLSGGAFDLENFVKQPQTILRCLSWVSA